MRFHLENEMAEIPEVLEKCAKREVGAALEEPILLTGMGSSVDIPCFSLFDFPEFDGVNFKVKYASEVAEGSSFGTAIALSNSGKTKETVDAFRRLGAKSKIAITREATSPLAALSSRTIQMLCGDEKAVPSTKSVVEQAYILRQLFFECFGKHEPIAKSEISAIRGNVEASFDERLVKKIADANRIYFCGSRGLSQEIRLKCEEILRKPAEAEVATQVLHASVCAIGEKDVVFLLGKDALSGYESILEKKISGEIVHMDDFGIKYGSKRYRDIMIFSGMLNLFVQAGKQMNLDLDSPPSLSKVATQ